MKTLIHSAQNLPRSFSSPLNPAALPLFCVLAFSPSILHLATLAMTVTHSWVGLGPIIAGFWLAAGLREIRVSVALLGIFLTALICAVNWLMLAGHACCSTFD